MCNKHLRPQGSLRVSESTPPSALNWCLPPAAGDATAARRSHLGPSSLPHDPARPSFLLALPPVPVRCALICPLLWSPLPVAKAPLSLSWKPATVPSWPVSLYLCPSVFQSHLVQARVRSGQLPFDSPLVASQCGHDTAHHCTGAWGSLPRAHLPPAPPQAPHAVHGPWRQLSRDGPVCSCFEDTS